MTEKDKNFKSLAYALEDHSAEGIAILVAEPSRFMRATIYLMICLLLAGLVWSFIGRADVIVTAAGVLSPESEVRRFYAPIEGEMVDIYIAEGTPVSEGDVLARINARRAIEVAANALDAELKLTDAEREYQNFPTRKALMERQAEALERKIAVEQKIHEKRVLDGMTKLAEAQKAKLAEARGVLSLALQELERTRKESEKLQRLANSEGGGGIARSRVDEAKNAYLTAQTNYRLAEAKLGELDFNLSVEYSNANAELESSDQTLTELRLQYESVIEGIDKESNKVDIQLKSSRLAADAAQRVSFDNIDEDNFLRILAPISGVITEVAFTQPGDKVQAHTPLGGIAPQDTRAIVKAEIQEQDRAFLREGLPVKLKFNAFPYERYGYINGTLEYISPTTQLSESGSGAVYKGHVRLEKDHFNVDDVEFPLRYGMAAKAEIVVRKRRLIDLALDPFRKVAG